MALTKKQIDALAYDPEGPKRQIHYDRGDVPGFGLMISPKGRKTFVLRYRPEGSLHPVLHTIGPYGTFTLQQAKEEARKALLGAKTGSDPVEARRVKRGDRSATTVREFAEVFMKRNRNRQGKPLRSAGEHQRRIDKHVVPALGSRKLTEVKRADVARLHGGIGDTAPYEANRVLALVAAMFSRAEEWGYVPEKHPNPAERVKPFQEQSRDRWVDEREMPRLWAAIEDVPDIYQRAAFKLYLLTGMRRNELLRLRWEQVDFDRGVVRLPESKAGGPQTVPLVSDAMAILRDLPPMLHNAHVFPGNRPGKPLVNIAKSWRRVRKAANLEDVRLHDLRRTVGSWIYNAGGNLGEVGGVLRHSTASQAEVYARRRDEAAREALERHAEKLRGVVASHS